MKIAFDAKRLFTNYTGLGNYSRSLVENLHAYFPEHSYHLLTPRVKENAQTLSFLQGPYQIHLPDKLPGAVWRTYKIPAVLKSHGVDIYHGLSHELPVGIQSSGAKSIVTIHDLIYLMYPKDFSFVDRQFYAWKFKYACNHADRIVAISESTKRDICKWFDVPEQKVSVIYQTCDDQFKREISTGSIELIKRKYQLPGNYLLYVGSVISRKNLLGIVKAIELIPNEKRLPLVVVGNGAKYLEQVQKYVSASGLKQWIIFTEKIIFTDLPAIYQGAEMLIYPSFYEGFGIPVIEGLFSKIPVITSGLSSMPEAGGKDTYYVDPNDINAIAKGILTIMEQTELKQKMIHNGYQYAARFDKQILSQQLMNLYQEVLKE